MSALGHAYARVMRFVKYYPCRMRARRKGLIFIEPNYIYFDRFDSSSVVVDVGCGFSADFSVHMISKYGLRAYGVDPTLKHLEALSALEEQTQGRFKHLMLAVTAQDGQISFNESLEHESGSVLTNHINVVYDKTRVYKVESVTLKCLVDRVGVEGVDYLKLDLEGAEYELLEAASKEELGRFGQIFVEFHHRSVAGYSIIDTKRIVDDMEKKGFTAFSVDLHNYLFVSQI